MAQREDYYQTLGVKRTATADEIRKSYRRLARKHHPDVNPGDKAAEEKFKQVAGAYDLLSDTEKRRRFDAGEIDATGAERQHERYYKDYAEAASGRRYQSASSGFDDFAQQDDFLAEELEAAIRILQRLQHRLQLTHMISDPASLAFGLASEVIMEEAQKAGE